MEPFLNVTTYKMKKATWQWVALYCLSESVRTVPFDKFDRIKIL